MENQDTTIVSLDKLKDLVPTTTVNTQTFDNCSSSKLIEKWPLL